jgi:biopolymer transport protein ExbD
MRKRSLILQDDESQELINLTPLLDVLFLILVFFILIAPLLDFDRIELAPSSQNKEELQNTRDSETIKIYLDKTGSIYLGTNLIQFSDLCIALDQYYKQNPKNIPQLYPDKNASFGSYQKIKNLVESIGFDQLDVVLKTE